MEQTKKKARTQKFSRLLEAVVILYRKVKMFFGTSLQQQAPATFKMVKNQSFRVEIAVADESVIYDVFDYSTAEVLVMTDTFVDGQDGGCVGKGDVVIDLIQMKLKKLGHKKNSSFNFEPQLLHSNEKNLEVSFSYDENDGNFWWEQSVKALLSSQ